MSGWINLADKLPPIDAVNLQVGFRNSDDSINEWARTDSYTLHRYKATYASATRIVWQEAS